MHIQHSAYATPRPITSDAEYETPAERLAAEVRLAIAAAGGDTRAAVLLLLHAAADDAEVAWELFAPYHERAARDAVLGEMRKTERAGRDTGDAHAGCAPAPSPLQNDRSGKGRTDTDAPRASASTGAVPQQPCREGQENSDARRAVAPDTAAPSSGDVGQMSSAPRTASADAPLELNENVRRGDHMISGPRICDATPAPSRPIHVVARQRAPRGLEAVQEMNRGLLRTFLVNGRPIADVTAAEAREWGAAQQQRGRFAILMAEGVPDHMRIGECKTEEDATRAAELSRA